MQNFSLKNLYFLHLKNSHLVFGSPGLPSPLAQAQNWRPQFGPFFLTVLSSVGSLWPGHKGAAGGFFMRLFHASAALKDKHILNIESNSIFNRTTKM